MDECTCGGRFPSGTGHSPLCPRNAWAADEIRRLRIEDDTDQASAGQAPADAGNARWDDWPPDPGDL